MSSVVWDETAGTRLRRAREAAGYKHATEIATKIGVKQNTMSGYENGKRFPAALIPTFAELYGVTADYLLTGKESTGSGASRISTVTVESTAGVKGPGSDSPTLPFPAQGAGGDAVEPHRPAPDDADPLLLLSRALRLLEIREENARVQIEQREQTERQRIEAQRETEQMRIQQVDAVNAGSLRRIVEALEVSRPEGGSSQQEA